MQEHFNVADDFFSYYYLKTNPAYSFICHNSMKVSSATSLAVIGSTELTLEYLWNKLNKYAISKGISRNV